MKSTALCLAVVLGLFCGPVQAALLGYQNFSGQLGYDALNIGPLLPDVPLSLVGNTVSDSLDSGQMTGEDSVRSYGGFASASIDASFLPTGFSFDLQVFSGGACLANNSSGSCPAGTTTNGEFEIEFTPDADTPPLRLRQLDRRQRRRGQPGRLLQHPAAPRNGQPVQPRRADRLQHEPGHRDRRERHPVDSAEPTGGQQLHAQGPQPDQRDLQQRVPGRPRPGLGRLLRLHEPGPRAVGCCSGDGRAGDWRLCSPAGLSRPGRVSLGGTRHSRFNDFHQRNIGVYRRV